MMKSPIDHEDPERLRLENQILRISEGEQRRIGRDLHEGLGQHLTGVELMLEALQKSLERESEENAARAAAISRHVRDAIRQTKCLARGLSPVETEPNGLMSALQELARSVREIFHLPCAFRVREPVLISDPLAATHLFRIAQEAVANAVKHDEIRTLTIEIDRQDGEARLSIADDGRGLRAEKNRGDGLRLMSCRAAVIGGRIEVQSNPTKGTKVVCVAPISSLHGRPGERETPTPNENAHPAGG